MKRLLAGAFFVLSVFFFHQQTAEAATGGLTGATPVPFTFPATTAGIGAFSDQVFTVRKTGGGAGDDFSVASVGFTAATSHFTILNDNCSGVTLPTGVTCTFTVRFNPVAAGTQSATVSVTAGAGDTTFTFGVSGLGLPDATVQFSQPVYSVDEAGAPTATLTVTRTGTDTSSAFTVAYTVTPIAPASSGDIGVPGPASPLSFASGQTSATINVPIVDDTLIETTETFLATLGTVTTGTGTPPILGTQSTALLAIADNEFTDTATIELSAPTYVAGEGAGLAHVVATRSGSTASAVSATVNTSSNTAIGGTDYTTISGGTVSFAAGEVAKDIPVAITNDTTVEGNESFNITLSAPTGGAVLGAQISSSVTIVDDDAPATFEFSDASYLVGESTGPAHVTILRSGNTNTAVAVNISTADGTAQNGASDYSSLFGSTVNFAAGEIAKVVNIGVNNDSNTEADEYFFVSLSGPSAGAILGVQQVSTVTIVDNDASASIEFSAPTYGVGESAGIAHIIAVRSGDLTGTSTIDVTTSDDTALSGSDYSSLFGSTRTFNPGQFAIDIPVTINSDTATEGNEDFNITLSNPTGAVLGVQQTSSVTIVDDDGGATVQFSQAGYAFGENAGTVPILVTRTGDTSGSVSVDIFTQDVSAFLFSDYNFNSGFPVTVTFNPGETAKFVNVNIIDDPNVETTEYFFLTMSNITGNAVRGANNLAQVSIIDNDGDNTIEFLDEQTDVAENVGTTQITLVRSGNISQSASVDVFTTNGTANGSDYFTFATTVNFSSNQAVATYPVSISDDTDLEPTEHFFLSMGNAVDGTVGAQNFEQVNILDDDGPSSTISLGQSVYTVGEADNFVAVTLVRSGNLNNNDSVNLSTTDITANGSDYSSVSNQTVNFNSGQVVRTVFIGIFNDTNAEPTESFAVSLSNPSQTTSIGNPNPAEVDIIDDDGPSSTFSFGQPVYTVGESDGNVVITVVRSGNTAASASVDLSTTDITADGSDYSGAFTTINFNPGDVLRTVSIGISNDSTPEPTQSFGVSLKNPSANASIGSPNPAEVDIIDDDIPDSVIQFSAPVYTVGEGAGIAHVIATRSGDTSTTATAQYNTSDDTALSGSDYSSANSTVTFNPGEIAVDIPVTITNDSTVEGDESFNITLTNPNTGTILGPQLSSSVVIVDNDGASVIQFAQPTYIFGEGGVSGIVVVTRSGNPGGTVTADYSETDLTATNGADFSLSPSPSTISFGPGEIAKTITVNLNDDATVESTETFRLNLSNPTGGASIGTNLISEVSILDNEGQATIQFGQANYVVSEGIGTFAAIVTRSGDVSTSVDVNVVPVDVTAVNGGTDYTLTNPTAVHFDAGETTQTVSISVVDDSSIEQTESFLLTFDASSLSSSAVLGVNSIAEVDILDNDGSSTFNLEKSEYAIGEGGVNLAVTVTRSGSTAVSQDVDVNTNDVSATGGVDYTDISTTTLTFGTGVTTRTVLIPILEDTDVETSETFTVELANPSGGALLGIQSTALATIVDNDGDATIEFSPLNYTFSEGLGVVTLTVIRSGDSSSAVTVPFTVTPVSAATPADFTVTTASPLVFGAGVTSQIITVTLADDSSIEPTETFRVALSPPTSGSAVLGVNSTASVDILDNDGDAVIQFSKPEYSFNEGLGTVTILVTRSGDSSTAVTAPFSEADVSAVGGGTDYDVTSSSPISFAIGETTKTITCALTDDSSVEEPETFDLILGVPTGGAILGANSTAEVTIIDDDNAGILEFTLDDYDVVEDSGAAVLTVTRTGGIDGAVSVDVDSAPGTALSPDDFGAVATTLNWADGDASAKTVTVTLVPDLLVEGPESFTVLLSNPTGDAVLGSKTNATVNILDDEAPGTLSFSSDTYHVEEAEGTITLSVLRQGGSKGQVTVAFATNDGTATSPTDYDSKSGTLTWNDGDATPRVISIPIKDTDNQTIRSFSVVLSAPSGGATLVTPSIAQVQIGFGVPSVPDTNSGGGGCALAASSASSPSSVPMALVFLSGVLVAAFRIGARKALLVGVAVVMTLAGGPFGCSNTPDVPAEAVQALERLVATATDLTSSFDSADSCTSLGQAVSDVNGNPVNACDTGDIQVSALVTDCNDAPAFSGTVTLVGVAEDCVDESDGTTVDGTVTFTIHTDGTKSVTFSSAGVTSNGIDYPIAGITVTLTDGGPSTCAGSFTVLERPCTVTPDCSTCEFLK